MQSKERAKQPLPFAAGFVDPWCHIFTFLEVDERFVCYRLCQHLKAILDTSAAWREVLMGSYGAKLRTDALIRLSRRVTIQFSSVVYDPSFTDVRIWHEIGAQRIIGSRVREIVLKSVFRQCYSNDHGWSGDLTDRLVPCSHALTSLTLPLCLVLKNLAALRTLPQLKKLVVIECYSEYCLFMKDEAWLQKTLQGLAEHVMPQITDFAIFPTRRSADVRLNDLDKGVMETLLPAATSLRSLSLRGLHDHKYTLPIVCPALRRLVVTWEKIAITPETAASLQSLEIGTREFDHSLLPPLPALQSLSFNNSFCVCDPELGYAVLSKTPNVKNYEAFHSLMVHNDDDEPRHWSGLCKLTGENIQSRFRCWWMARMAFARASNVIYNGSDDYNKADL